MLLRQEIHAEWEDFYLSPQMDRFYDAVFAEIGARLGAHAGARLLDAGCGYCHHAVRLARQGFEVTGVDFSEAALAPGRSYLEEVGMAGQIELLQANLLDLPFDDDSWTYVHCSGVLMHVPQVEQALRELARVTAPGGRLIITENNMRSVQVAVWNPMLRMAKRVLGRTNPALERTPRGTEMWFDKPGGRMLVRMMDIEFLERFLADQGLELEARLAGEFTEIYTSVPGKPIKRVIQEFNQIWFERVGRAGPAMGNILIFNKG